MDVEDVLGVSVEKGAGEPSAPATAAPAAASSEFGRVSCERGSDDDRLAEDDDGGDVVEEGWSGRRGRGGAPTSACWEWLFHTTDGRGGGVFSRPGCAIAVPLARISCRSRAMPFWKPFLTSPLNCATETGLRSLSVDALILVSWERSTLQGKLNRTSATSAELSRRSESWLPPPPPSPLPLPATLGR